MLNLAVFPGIEISDFTLKIFDLNQLFSEMPVLRNLEIFLFGKNTDALLIHGKQLMQSLKKAKNVNTYAFTSKSE